MLNSLITSFIVLGSPASAGQPPDTQPAVLPPPVMDAALSREQLEQQFTETLTGAVLVGSWQEMTVEGLGPARTERYTISRAQKIGEDFWLIHARIQVGEKDLTVPVPLRVLWAGDTPIITLTDLAIPGLGTYSARVMIYRGLYSGTWFAPDHYGVLCGRIEKAAPPPATQPAAPGD